MSLAACAALVERADPDRFLATMAAPPEARARLWPLYAFNIEISRAPWTSTEPMIGEMRLQWWADTVAGIGEGAKHPAHDVAGPLAELVSGTGIPASLLETMTEARRSDLETEPFTDLAAFSDYLDRTSGNLMWAAALALDAPPEAEAAVRDFAWAAGLAAYLRAVPELAARGRRPLPDADLAELARSGLTRIAAARASGRLVPATAVPALLPGWQARWVLSRVAAEASRVEEGRLSRSEFGRRASLLLRAVTGRW
ncbi:phytoene/squalene synthase family protein [Ostreiculturibacter nitratireducens]|uniref:phytoene/squalene synthase family protein n=1 Tax=Ostreiculturibacter nitratireducens TaxID=3075226 RepID=UPI0031B5EEC6